MILVLPVSDVDLDLATKLAAWMKKLGGMEKRTVVLAITRRASWAIGPVMEHLVSSFGEMVPFTLPTENEEGWPESPNHFFYSTMEYLHDGGNTEPIYWFEADNVPLRPGWLDAIEAEYHAAGKRYMGVINKTLYQNLETGKTWYEGRHLVGTGIYSADFFTHCKSVHFMDRRPFDICIEKEVVPEAHDTKLIAHRWGTRGYRRENGLIMMDDKPDPLHIYAKPIPPEAVVVHGDKSGTLIDLLESERAVDNLRKGAKV